MDGFGKLRNLQGREIGGTEKTQTAGITDSGDEFRCVATASHRRLHNGVLDFQFF